MTNPATGVTVSVTAPTSVVTSTSKNDLATDESLTKTTGGQIVWTVKLTDSNDATVDPVYYTIRINVAKASTDTSLKSLKIKGVEVDLSTVDDQGSGNYNIDDTIVITAADNASDALKIEAVATDPNATVTVSAAGTAVLPTTNLDTDKGALTVTSGAKGDSKITVTAEDGTTTAVYTLTSLEVKDAPVTVTLTNAGGATVTGIANNDKIITGKAIDFTVAPSAATKFIEKVTYQITAGTGNMASAEEPEHTGNKWPLPALPDGATAVTIVVTEKALPMITNSTGGSLTIIRESGKIVAVANNGTEAVEIGESVTFEVTPGTVLTVDGTAGTEYTKFERTSTGDVRDIWTLTGIVDDVEIS